MNTVTRVEEFLQERYGAVIENFDDLPNQTLVIDEPITEQEASFFLMGLERNVFSIDDEGYVQSLLLPGPPKNSSKQRMIQMFWHHGGGVRKLFREGINQMAAACRLIFEYGWEIDEIKMEPSIAEFGQLAYGVDIVVVGPDSAIPLCCESKRNNSEFEKLMKQFMSCCSMGEHLKEVCINKDNHPKYDFCIKAKPKYFWLVSPTNEVCLELSYVNGGLIQLTELPELLDKEAIISNCKY